MFELDPIFNLINPDNTVTVNRYLIHAIGLEETVLYGAMISKREYYAKSGELEDEWFHCPKAFLEEATGISMRRLAIIYKKLVDEGLLEIKKVGLPSKNYYRIVNDAFLVNRLLEKGRKISADKLAKAAGETTERTSEKGEKEPESPVFISSTKTCTTGDTQTCTTSDTETCTTSDTQSCTTSNTELCTTSDAKTCRSSCQDYVPTAKDLIIREKNNYISTYTREAVAPVTRVSMEQSLALHEHEGVSTGYGGG